MTTEPERDTTSRAIDDIIAIRKPVKPNRDNVDHELAV